mgnify:CR=1 FL=1
MDKEITLLPADRYMVINKSILTDVDQKNLISFLCFEWRELKGVAKYIKSIELSGIF